MKKLLGLFILTSVLLTLGFITADVEEEIPVCATYETTFVSGVITDATNGNLVVEGANVVVTCTHDEQEYTKSTTSDDKGGYSVQFDADECGNGDEVMVEANFEGLTGDNDNVFWYTWDDQVGCLELIVNVACGNVPLVPEFGTVVGIVTALGALGAFFIVRRK